MKAIDYLKAGGIALAILLLNYAVAFLTVAAYAAAVEPGRDQAFYTAAAGRLVPWAVGMVAPLLFLAAGFLAAARRPERNGLMFAAALVVVYVVLDVASALAMGRPDAATSPVFLRQMGGHGVAALLGAALGARRAAAPSRPARTP